MLDGGLDGGRVAGFVERGLDGGELAIERGPQTPELQVQVLGDLVRQGLERSTDLNVLVVFVHRETCSQRTLSPRAIAIVVPALELRISSPGGIFAARF